jgi:Concanavalin A-like lectin/glucanases superfamily
MPTPRNPRNFPGAPGSLIAISITMKMTTPFLRRMRIEYAALLMAAAPAAAIELFSEDFDAEIESKIGTNNGIDVFVEYVNYSDMTVGSTPHNIPEAPRRIPGSLDTRGVLMRVNYAGVATERIANLVALDDAGGSRVTFTDNYRLKFDFYLRLSPNVTLGENGFPTDTGTTEQVLWGVGYAATQPMGRGWRTGRGNGMWGWVSVEGGHGATFGADAALYSGPTLIGGRNMDLVNSTADVSAYFAPAFGADASPVPNCPANQWVEATISVRAGQVTVEYMAVGRTITKFFENVSGPVAGGIMVGYEDSFNSVSFDPDNQWLLVDNMVVEDITPPTLVVAPTTAFRTFTGTPVTGSYSITNTRGAGDLTVSAVNFSGTHGTDFSVTTPLPIVVGPGATVPLDIVFNPAAPNGVKSASITIVSDDSQTPNYVIGDVRVRRSVGSFFEAHYKLDELSGTSLADASGNGVTGALQVREPLTYGRPSLLGAADAGFAMSFLPAQTSASGNYFTSAVVHTPTVSVSLWLRPGAAGALRTLFQRDYDSLSPYDKLFGLLLTSDGIVRYRVRSTDIMETDPLMTPVTDDTVWHIVLTHLDEDGFGNDTAARSRIYINGLLAVEKTSVDTQGFDDYPLNPAVAGMHFATRTIAGFGYAGDLDDVQVYGVELSREQVWELYKRPGAAASPLFNILTVERTAAPSLAVTVPSSPQGTYRLFRSGDLQAWEAAGAAVPGDASGLATSLTDASPPADRQFYRVERQ